MQAVIVIAKDKARGARLRELRVARGLTQQQVAHALRVEKSNVSRWEAGTTFPRDYLRQLVELYRTSAEYVVFGHATASPIAYGALHDFERWLQASPLRAGVTPRVLEIVRGVRLPLEPGEEPTLETYRLLLYAALSIELKQRRT